MMNILLIITIIIIHYFELRKKEEIKVFLYK